MTERAQIEVLEARIRLLEQRVAELEASPRIYGIPSPVVFGPCYSTGTGSGIPLPSHYETVL